MHSWHWYIRIWRRLYLFESASRECSDGENADQPERGPEKRARQPPMTRAKDKFNVVIARLVEIDALESAVQREDLFGFAIRRRREISRLAFGKADDARRARVNIESR